MEAKINREGLGGVGFRCGYGPWEPFVFGKLPLGWGTGICAVSPKGFQTGSLYGGNTTTVINPRPSHPSNEWFSLEVIADRNRIRTVVDGKTIVDHVDMIGKPLRGFLNLEHHLPTTTIRFRKVEIKQLEPAATNAPPPLAVDPFDAAQAKAHQEAWAKHLGMPVEYTNAIGMKFRLIPPGEFVMVASEEEIKRALVGTPPSWLVDRVNAEGPQRQTTVPAPYYLGQFEVTLGQFRRFVRETGHKTTAETNGKGGVKRLQDGLDVSPKHIWSSLTDSSKEDHPVVFVSMNDARQFCTWLGTKDGRTHALPRDDQWEFACRGGTTTPWYSGDEVVDVHRIAWGAENSQGGLQPDGRTPTRLGCTTCSATPRRFASPSLPGRRRCGAGGWTTTETRAEVRRAGRWATLLPLDGRQGQDRGQRGGDTGQLLPGQVRGHARGMGKGHGQEPQRILAYGRARAFD